MKNKKFWSIFSISLATLTLGGVISAVSIKTLDTSHTCEVGTNLAYSSTSHFYTCTNEYCANKFYEEEHDLEWVIDKEETFEENGVKHEICKTCNYKRNVGTVIDDIYNSNEATVWVTAGDTTITNHNKSANGTLNFGTIDLRVNSEGSIADNEADALAYRNGTASGLVWDSSIKGNWITFDEVFDTANYKWNGPNDYDPLIALYNVSAYSTLVKYKQNGESDCSYLPFPDMHSIHVYLVDAEEDDKKLHLEINGAGTAIETIKSGVGRILFKYGSTNIPVTDGNGNTVVAGSRLNVKHSMAGTLDTPLSICVANNALYIPNAIGGTNYKIIDNIKQYIPSGKIKIEIGQGSQTTNGASAEVSWFGTGSEATLVNDAPSRTYTVFSALGGMQLVGENEVKVSDLDITVPTYSTVDYGTKVNVTAPTIKLKYNGVTLNTSKLVAKIGDSKLPFRGLNKVEYYFYKDSTIEYYYDGVKVCESTIKVKW